MEILFLKIKYQILIYVSKKIFYLSISQQKIKNVKILNVKEMYFGLNKIKDISPLKNCNFKCLRAIGFAGNLFVWDKDNKKIINNLISKNKIL